MISPYYERDGITLYHGDNREILPLLGAASFDLIVTSPPYNLSENASGSGGFRRTDGSKWNGGALADGYADHDDAMADPEYVAWQHSFLRACWPLLTDRGAIFYNHKPRPFNGEVRLPTRLNPGLPLRQVVIWKRTGGVNFSPSHYVPTHEWLLIFAKPDFQLKSKGASGVGDVWEFPPDNGNPHPAPFPLQLPARVIESVAPRSVLDPFSGSGTTLRAALNAGIRGVGIEKTRAYCDMTIERLQQSVLPLELSA